jgi:hypothetical protein
VPCPLLHHRLSCHNRVVGVGAERQKKRKKEKKNQKTIYPENKHHHKAPTAPDRKKKKKKTQKQKTNRKSKIPPLETAKGKAKIRGFHPQSTRYPPLRLLLPPSSPGLPSGVREALGRLLNQGLFPPSATSVSVKLATLLSHPIHQFFRVKTNRVATIKASSSHYNRRAGNFARHLTCPVLAASKPSPLPARIERRQDHFLPPVLLLNYRPPARHLSFTLRRRLRRLSIPIAHQHAFREDNNKTLLDVYPGNHRPPNGNLESG